MIIDSLSTYSRPVLTSALYGLTAAATEDSVKATIKWSDGTKIYETDLTVASGTATLYDVGEILRHALEAEGKSCGSFTIAIGTKSATINVVFCDRKASSAIVSKRAFLTVLPSQVYFQKCEFSVASPLQDLEEPLRLAIVARTCKGNFKRYDYQGNDSPLQFTENGVAMGSFSDLLDDIREIEEEKNTEETDPELPVGLVSLSVSLGKKSKIFYFIDREPDVVFYFRNCFNAIEILPVWGVIETKWDVQNSKAVSMGKVLTYDHSRTISYKVKTAGIKAMEADALAQISFSKEVYVKTVDGDPVRVVITQNDFNTTTEKNKMNSAEISFEADSLLPLVHTDVDREISSDENGIFSSPFATEFS